MLSVFFMDPGHEFGGGFELIYDWANDGSTGTGWNIFVYPQYGVSTNPGTSIGVGVLSSYNFAPDNYTGPFLNANLNLPVSDYGGPSLGISMTPDGMDQWVNNGCQLSLDGITVPYTYYGGWTFGDGPSMDLEAQLYFDWTSYIFGVNQ